MVYRGTLFHRRQRGIPMHAYENRSQIRAPPPRSGVQPHPARQPGTNPPASDPPPAPTAMHVLELCSCERRLAAQYMADWDNIQLTGITPPPPEPHRSMLEESHATDDPPGQDPTSRSSRTLRKVATVPRHARHTVAL